MIYLIATKDRQFCKIGRAADVKQRLRAMQTASPISLEVVATRDEPDAFEWLAHKEFEAARLRGEWFVMSDAIVERFLSLEFKAADPNMQLVDFADQMDAIVVRARRVRKSIRAICIKAGVAPSTWSRWQAQAVEPNQSTMDRLNAALDEFEREAA